MEASSPTPPRPSASPAADLDALPIKTLRRALDDLFEPQPLRYWLDFIASAGSFWGGLGLVGANVLSGPFKLAAALVAVLGLYRAVIFIHELAHFPPGRMRGFRLAWNLVCGIPLMAPDFLYGSHADHHRRRAYGTADDGEYLPWGLPGHRAAILGFVLSALVAFPAGILRFGLLAPLSWLSPALRGWVAVSASSLVVDVRYRRALPAAAEARRWRLQEAAAFAYLCAVAGGLSAGLIPAGWLAQLYLAVSAALLLNALRTLAAHRYEAGGAPLPAAAQFLDSIDYPGRPFPTVLWAPVGLRFHAVHHLFPGIPYHNLAAAHARILRLLPPDSPYRRTQGRGLLNSLRSLWLAAGRKRGPVVRGSALRGGDAGAA